MNSTRILTRLTFVLGLAFMPAFGQKAGVSNLDAPQQGRKAGRAEAVVRRLKLSEAQQNALKTIRSRHAEQLLQGRQNAREARRNYRQAARDPQTPVEQLRLLHRAMAERQFEVLRIRRTMKEEVRALLTPEQREEAARLRGLHQVGQEAKAGRSDR